MRRRVLSISAIAAIAATTALAGCSAVDTSQRAVTDCEAPLAPGALSDSVTISGESADSLSVSLLEDATAINSQRSLVVAAEDRSRVALEGSVVSGNVAYVDGATGEVLDVSADFLSGAASDVFLASPADPFSGSLLCAAPGDIVAVALSEQDSAAFNYLGGGLLLLAEITDVSGVRAEGAAQVLPTGFPAVATDENGRPGIVLPPQEAPNELRSAARVLGEGEKVGADQLVIGQALTVDWSGLQQSNTWETQVMSFGTEAQTQSGFRAALTGFPVGSQVVVIQPVEGGPAQVSVVDILAAV